MRLVWKLLQKLSVLYCRDIYPSIADKRGATFLSKKLGEMGLRSYRKTGETIKGLKIPDLEKLDPSIARKIVSGQYEAREEKLIESYLPTESDVIELGGGVGYISCIINSKIEKESRQIVLEANKKLISTIENFKKLNESDFEIYNLAYDPKKEEIDFMIKESFLGSSSYYMDQGQKKTIEAISLESLLNQKDIKSFSLVADIEGAEYSLLDEEIDIISRHCNFILIEFHNIQDQEQKYLEAQEKISNNGFTELEVLKDEKESVHAFRKN